MRAISFQTQRLSRLRRENLPACALFLLLYAFGVSCGMASYGETFRIRMQPTLFAAWTKSVGQGGFVRPLLCAGAAAIAQSALLLLTGLSAWLLPLWAVWVLLRACTVGVCAQFCVYLLQSGMENAHLFVLILASQFALTLPAEAWLGMLPLVRRTQPGTGDAEYLFGALRTALFYVLLTVLLTAAATYAMCRVCTG